MSGKPCRLNFPGLKNINKPIVWEFAEIVACLDCGNAKCFVPETELRELSGGDAAAVD